MKLWRVQCSALTISLLAGSAQAGLTDPFPAVFELSSLLPTSGGDGSLGFVLEGVDASDYSGQSVSSAGDVNGDGVDDLIIGADLADPGGRSDAGESHVVFGRNTALQGPFPASFQLSSLDGTNGFSLDGADAFDGSGDRVSSAGDVNGDGVDDLVIGAPSADPGGRSDAGESYVVFGRNTALQGPFPASIQLSSLDGTNGFRLDGVDAGDLSGFSVSSAGDVNGDGVDDLIIGAPFADPDGQTYAGESYVVFGRRVPPLTCPGDADGDRMISFPDITAILRNWNVSYAPGTGPGDSDGNGVVEFPDLTATLRNWGMTCPN